jgi:hypothetical protein
MERNTQNRVTKKFRAIESDLVQDICSEPACGMTILVEKEDKTKGRKSRCMSCLMRAKVMGGEIK